MILLYAEVLNENEGPTAKAVAQVNRVRTRAGLPELKDSKYYKIAEITADKNAFRDHVKVERALETAFECIRWIDTKRWGINDQTALTEYKARDTDYNNFIIGKSIRMPIPQSEVDNNPNLDQISY